MAFPARGQVFISEYVEGSLTNRALEIYNGSSTTIDLFAAGYEIVFYYSGSATPSRTIQLLGTVAPGDVYVLAHQTSDSAVLAEADQVDGGGFFDGDDAVQLVNKDGAVDVIGQIGVDPGTEWGSGLTSTRDNTLCRKSSVLFGDSDGTDAFDPATQWDGFARDFFIYLGEHTAGGLPVELVSFTAVSLAGDVTLQWTTASEQGNAGFEIQEVQGIAGRSVGFVAGAVFTDRPTTYSHRIPDVQAGRHVYRLKQIDLNGSFAFVGRVEVDVVPARLGLLSVYPNPFNPVAHIVYALPADGRVQLHLLDVMGREVAVPFDGWRTAGVHTADLQATGLASGLYVIRLAGTGYTDFRTIVLAE
ncbi:MAG: lamin tail domain-containing protein [Rhodothermales bacterium]|nr:lamin tail domain-containing protein [Rhodothermales bacterium]